MYVLAVLHCAAWTLWAVIQMIVKIPPSLWDGYEIESKAPSKAAEQVPEGPVYTHPLRKLPESPESEVFEEVVPYLRSPMCW